MRALTARPHLMAHSDRVEAAAWLLGDPAEPIPDGPISGWDPTIDLVLEREIRLDPGSIRHDCDLPQDAPLCVATVWACPATSVRGGVSVPVEGEAATKLRLHVSGGDLLDHLTVRTQVLLAGATNPLTPLGPHLPGSVLWETEDAITLQGASPRFPMEWLDFAESGWLPPDAGWYMDWAPEEPDLPSLGAIRLYLNSSHDVIREAVSAPAPDAAQTLLREAIEFDVIRTLVQGAMDTEESWSDDQVFEEGSIGSSVGMLLATLFPNDSLESLRGRWRSDPQRVVVRLQAAASLFQRQR